VLLKIFYLLEKITQTVDQDAVIRFGQYVSLATPFFREVAI